MTVIRMKNVQPSFTFISNIFIDHYLPKANPVYVMVYIYTYRHSFGSLTDSQITIESIATALSLPKPVVNKALEYWKKEGLINLSEAQDQQMESQDQQTEKELLIEFLPLSAADPITPSSQQVSQSSQHVTQAQLSQASQVQGSLFAQQEAQANLPERVPFNQAELSAQSNPTEAITTIANIKPTEATEVKEAKEPTEPAPAAPEEMMPNQSPSLEPMPVPLSSPFIFQAPKILLETRPQYTVEELEIYRRQSEEINHLFRATEKSFGRFLNYNDLNVLFGLYDWLRLPLDVIELLVNYCGDNNIRSIRYVEKVAMDWCNKGIDSLEVALEYLKLHNGDYKRIMKAIGQSKRDPAEKEVAYMNKWLKEMGMPVEVVIEACERTIMSIGKPNFEYIDKMLGDWFSKGIKNLEDVKKYEVTFRASKKETYQKEEKKKVKKGRFANFTQRETDYDEIERLEREYIQNLTNIES